MNPVILFRAGYSERDEESAVRTYFRTITQRAQIQKDDFVIPRYSALPFFQELCGDIQYLGGTVINSYKQHMFIADLENWYAVLRDITPRTWFRLGDIPYNEEGPFVLKGATNSRKHQWLTHMYASNITEAQRIHWELSNDGFIGDQSIYIRKFVNLRKFLIGVNGMPVTNEWRTFVLYGKILASGYYWSNYWDDLEEKPQMDSRAQELLELVIDRVGNASNFYVIDIGQLEDGSWTVVELNDGMMSGLSMIDPDILYKNMYEILRLNENNHNS